jgi:hypothetical protein
MTHSNQKVLEQIYENFSNGNTTIALAACADNITFQIAGKNGGKFTKTDFFTGYLAKLSAKGPFKLEIHDVLANDRHGIVLASNFFTRGAETTQIRTVHVWRFENGKPVAWYEYPRDLYQFDAVLGNG